MKKNNSKVLKIEVQNDFELIPVPIVSDALICNGQIADGCMFPVLILNTENRPDINHLFSAHEYFSDGEADSLWETIKKQGKTIKLVIQFKKPTKCIIIIEFDIVKQGVLIEQILISHGVFLQAGRPGDRLANTLEDNRIFVQMPDIGFYKEWDAIFRKALIKDGKHRGLNRNDAKEYCEEILSTMRKFAHMRKK